MDKSNGRVRGQLYHKSRQRKLQTNKVVDRITFNPKIHKQKIRRKMREELQLRKDKEPQIMKPPSPSIKFGSFNINGLDMETSWAVEELVKKHGFDVIVKRERR